MLIVKIIENNTMYSVQKLYLCIFSVKVISAIFTSSVFLVLFSTNLLTIFFCTYSFHNRNIHQHHMIFPSHTRNYQDSNQITCRLHPYHLILCIHTCIYHHSNIVYYYKQCHLVLLFYVSFFISWWHQMKYFDI